MRYNKGDKVVYFQNGKLIEEEICWVRHDAGSYYHLQNDDKIGENDIVGHVDIHGRRIVSETFYEWHDKAVAEINVKMHHALKWVCTGEL